MEALHIWISVVVFLCGVIGGFLVSWGALNQQVKFLAEDMKIVKKALHLTGENGGEGGVVLRAECFPMERAVRAELSEIKRRMDETEATLVEIQSTLAQMRRER